MDLEVAVGKQREAAAVGDDQTVGCASREVTTSESIPLTIIMKAVSLQAVEDPFVAHGLAIKIENASPAVLLRPHANTEEIPRCEPPATARDSHDDPSLWM